MTNEAMSSEPGEGGGDGPSASAGRVRPGPSPAVEAVRNWLLEHSYMNDDELDRLVMPGLAPLIEAADAMHNQYRIETLTSNRRAQLRCDLCAAYVAALKGLTP